MDIWAGAGMDICVGAGGTGAVVRAVTLPPPLFFRASSIGTSRRACTERARERNVDHVSPPNTAGAPFKSQYIICSAEGS